MTVSALKKNLKNILRFIISFNSFNFILEKYFQKNYNFYFLKKYINILLFYRTYILKNNLIFIIKNYRIFYKNLIV